VRWLRGVPIAMPPISASWNTNEKPCLAATAFSTGTVADRISGPMPSPGSSVTLYEDFFPTAMVRARVWCLRDVVTVVLEDDVDVERPLHTTRMHVATTASNIRKDLIALKRLVG
jgi:hypothetical protein